MQHPSHVSSQAEDLAEREGKLLFVGEFGGPAPNFTGPTRAAQAYPSAVLELQAPSHASSLDDAVLRGKGGMRLERPFAASAIWAFACPTHLSTMRCLHANVSLHLSYHGSECVLALLRQANRRLAGTS